MRAFIAVDLPSDIKTKIAKVTDQLKENDLAFNWVKSKNLHLTLKFLGDINKEKFEKIKEKIETVAKKFEPFSIELKKFGFFPNERKPRVFFIQTSGEEVLGKIAASIEEELENFGFEKEKKFKSHITLGRPKKNKNIKLLLKIAPGIKIKDKVLVDRISIFKSTLTNQGPIYEEIFSSNLTK